MAYTRINWSNGGVPAINETNLNKIEQGIYDATYVDGVKVGTSVDSDYKVNILYSANLFDESTYTNGMAWNNATGFPSRATAYFNITAGKTYSISASNISRLNGGGVNVFEKSQPSASTSISSVVSFDTDGSFTFTASSGATILAIQLSIPSGNISSSNYPDIMIVEGSTPKPYVKYVSQPSININGNTAFYGNTYSTTEQRIGTWLGKPLYRRVFTGNFANNNRTTIGNYPNINPKNAYGNFGYAGNILFFGKSDDQANLTVRVQLNSLKDLTLYHTTDLANNPYELILEYTKTTD